MKNVSTSKQNNIRNFAIIAHIDHGKSTLADRILEKTGNIKPDKSKDRILDTLELEQERGITIKLQTARMEYKEYILNLVDTPGHVDFAYEVSRALAACEGALLLIDASKGIQAQTLSTVYQALEYNLTLIPVINKIDLPNAKTEAIKADLISVFGFKEEEILKVSAKTGVGVDYLLDTIVEKIPPADINHNDNLKCLIFDSFYHEHKGVVAIVRVFNGALKKNKEISLFATKTDVEPIEIGYITPEMKPQDNLVSGEIGYIATGLKDIKLVQTGDTITTANVDISNFTPLKGYQRPKPMVYAGFFPQDSNEQKDFRESIEKYGLNDAAFSYVPDNSPAIGFGFRCSFLGLLHLEIVQQRIDREFGIDMIVTSPTVEYAIKPYKLDNLPEEMNLEEITNKNFSLINSPIDLPENIMPGSIYEPIAKVEILTPENYIGPIMELCQSKRGTYLTTEYLSNALTNKVQLSKRYSIIKYEIPLSEIITDFFDKLKSVSSGYASLDYNVIKYKRADIVKVDFLINHDILDALSILIHRELATSAGKTILKNLLESIPRQNFRIPLQAAINGSIIAREDIAAYRKDVTAKLYGGDYSRKKKLLEKQKKGKKRLEKFGKVEIPKEVYLATIKR